MHWNIRNIKTYKEQYFWIYLEILVVFGQIQWDSQKQAVPI